MKRHIKKFSILLIALFAMTTAYGQVSTYNQQPGYWILGLNGGLAYQQGDVPALLDGYGAGLTLGKNIFYKQGAPFSFDLRGRALYTRTYGLDHAPSLGIAKNNALNGTKGPTYLSEGGGPGYAFLNHKTDLAELGLEGVLNFNQLAERSNVLLSLYGGVGIDWYKTATDQLDASGTYATQYEGIDTRRSVSSIRNTLKNEILDGHYETNAHGFKEAGKLGIMPSLGAELGYQLSPKFSMGIGHRVTFAGNDLLDGQQWNNANNLTGDNDLHHYTSLHMRWKIQGQQTRPKAPQITITAPDYNPLTSRHPNAEVRAIIKHINGPMDVDARLNGHSIYFDLQKDKFRCDFPLEFGRNELVITATNSVGREQKKVVVFYQEAIIDNPEPPVAYRPQVTITNPRSQSTTVQQDQFTVRATIKNINSRDDIRFIVNGREQYGFDFRASKQTFSAAIPLQYGRNDIRIKAFNATGEASDAATIYFEQRYTQNPPRIRITKPNRNPYYTQKRHVKVEAQITNITHSSEIEYYINGQSSRNFEFANNCFLANTTLREGRNTLTIKAFNRDGEDSEEVIVIYEIDEPVVEDDLPEVRITRPAKQHSTTTYSTASIRAQLRHVDRKSDIDFFLNGRSFTNFRYQKNTGRLEATVTLKEGNNSITIKGHNATGSAEDEVFIAYTKKVIHTPKPPTINISKPRNNSTTEQAITSLEASVTNIADKRDIEVLLNGRRIKDFSFNSNRKLVTARMTLREGNNTITVKAVNDDGQDQQSVAVRYKKKVIHTPKPPTVNISKPRNNSITEQATTSLEASVTNIADKRDIEVLLNGRRIKDFSFNSNRKLVTAQLTLREGNNTITVKAINDDGQDQQSVAVRYKKKVIHTPKPPTVNISKPRNNSTTEQATTSLEASVTNIADKRNIEVLLNDRRINDFSFNSNRKLVTARLTLREGNNTITVKAINDDGQDQQSVTVRYKKKVLPIVKPPVVNITAPAKATTQATQKRYLVKATIEHIKNKNDITFTLNNRRITDFSFNSKTQSFSASISLKEGNNKIQISAVNKAGRDKDEASIRYTIALPAPTVNISSPKNNSLLKVDQTTVQASIQHVQRKANITFKLNGKAISNFSFGKSRLTANVQLKEGKNRIEITVKNSAGSDKDMVQVTYQKTVSIAKPTVKFLAPRKKGELINTAKYVVKASIQHVKSKADISFWMNGKPIQQFEFDTKKQLLTATISPRKGRNDFKIEARNKAGKATANTQLNYSVKTTLGPAPTIANLANSRPAANPFNPSEAKTRITANLTNVSSNKQIDFQVNGKRITNFTLDAKKKTFSALITLKKGKNTVDLKVTNNGLSDEQTLIITF